MKSIKFGPTALVALMAVALASASSAMAEGNTAFCEADESPCSANNFITHSHAVTQVGKKTTLLTSAITVECDGLFLGDARSALASPLILDGAVTYSNCNNKCTVTEENGPAEVRVLKTGHESASFTFKLLLHVVCGAFFNCRYKGEGLEGHIFGPLLSTAVNGEFTVEKQKVTKDSGTFCPEKGEIDVVATSLEQVFISD
ncbi:MAG TPA: hypothetical protein VFJ64_02845 [Solirubrobacterales bacterium]|nr:hypothetical protein [Solirubrobacterales bacterium]